MPEISRLTLRYETEGAEKVQRQDEKVREGVQTTGRTAQKEETKTNRWMAANKTALLAIGAAAAAGAAILIKASPSLSASMDSIRAAFSLMAMEAGESLAPALEAAEEASWALQESFEAQSKPVQGFMTLGIVGFLIGLESESGTLTKTVDSLKSGWTGLKDAFSKSIEPIKRVAKGWGDSLKDMWERLGPIREGLAGIGDKIGEMLGPVKDALSGMWSKVTDFMGRIWDSIKETFSKVVKFIPEAFDKLVGFIADLPDKVMGVVDKITGFFSGLPDKIVSGLKGIGSKIWNGIKDGLGGLKDKFLEFIDKAYQWGADLVQKFIDGIKSMGGKLKDVGGDILDGLKDVFSFDQRANDAMAFKWGVDMLSFMQKGIASQIMTPEFDAGTIISRTIGTAGTPIGAPALMTGGGPKTINFYLTVAPGAVQIGAGEAMLAGERVVGEGIFEVFEDQLGARL